MIRKDSTLIETLIILIIFDGFIKMPNVLDIEDISLILRIECSYSLTDKLPYKVLVSHWVFVLAYEDSICLSAFVPIFSEFRYMLFYLGLPS